MLTLYVLTKGRYSLAPRCFPLRQVTNDISPLSRHDNSRYSGDQLEYDAENCEQWEFSPMKELNPVKAKVTRQADGEPGFEWKGVW